MPKIQLVTQWFGAPLPDWWDKFVDRLALNPQIHLTLFSNCAKRCNNKQLRIIEIGLNTLCELIENAFHCRCNKKDGYHAGELRPAIRYAWSELFADCDWWGWIDLDVYLGKLPELDDSLDVISCWPKGIAGEFCLFNRRVHLWDLMERANYRAAYSNPSHLGFAEQDLTKAAKVAGLNCDYTLRHAHRNREGVLTEDDKGRLYHNGERIWHYHFREKVWPAHLFRDHEEGPA